LGRKRDKPCAPSLVCGRSASPERANAEVMRPVNQRVDFSTQLVAPKSD